MFKNILALLVLVAALSACASWFSSSKPDSDTAVQAPNNPAVGSKDSSDFSFGQAASVPAKSPSSGTNDVQPVPASAPVNASGVSGQ